MFAEEIYGDVGDEEHGIVVATRDAQHIADSGVQESLRAEVGGGGGRADGGEGGGGASSTV